MPLGPQAEALLKKLADSGTQPFETMTLAVALRPLLAARGIVTLIVLGRKGPHGFPFRRPHSHLPIH